MRELEEREQQEREESEERGRPVREQEEMEREFSRRLARVERDYTRRLQLEREALGDEEGLERRDAGQLVSWPSSFASSSLFPSTSPSLFLSTSPSLLSSTSVTSNDLSSTASSLPTSTNPSTSPTSSPGLENVWRMLDIDRREGDQLRKAMERLAVGEEEQESDDDLDSEADEEEFLASVERLAEEVQDKVAQIVDRLEELNSRSRRGQEELVKEQEGKMKEQEAAQRQERRNLSDQFHFEVEEMRARQEPNWLGLAGLTKEEVTTSLHLLFRGFEQEKQDLEEEQEQRMGVMLKQQEMALLHTLEQQQLQKDSSSRSSLAALTVSLTASLAQLTSKPSLARSPQCPGCQEELVTRILQCQAGHLLCGECGAREEQCAVCGGQVEGRATAMEHFLAELTGQERPEEQAE